MDFGINLNDIYGFHLFTEPVKKLETFKNNIERIGISDDFLVCLLLIILIIICINTIVRQAETIKVLTAILAKNQ